MKITIKAEAKVPYTTEVISQDVVIQRTLDDADHARLVVAACREVETIVSRRVDEEMEKRGIKLGPDGLRLPNDELSDGPSKT